MTPKYSFTTRRHGWVCAGPASNYYMGTTDCPGFSSDCPNNSSPQGWYWYDQASDSNMALTGTNKCKGTGTGQGLFDSEAEGVEGGFDPIFTTTSETTEIESDMKNECQ